MNDISKKRKAVTNYLVKALSILEPSGHNAKLYRDKFNAMSDKEFDKYMKNFLGDRKQQIYVEMVEYEREVTMESIAECAKFMNVPLYEDIVLPMDSEGTMSVSPQKVPVGYVHVRRMPQTLMKKSSGSIEIDKRDSRTGQVSGDDKNARNSDMETYSLIAIGANAALKEFMGPRADDMVAKAEMYNAISKNGYVSLSDLTNDTYNKIALNTLDTYYLMQGISTNLVSDLDAIPGPR